MPGTTPILGLPYPLYSEAVDGPAQIQALAEAVDNVVAPLQTTLTNAQNRKSGAVSAVAVQAIPNAVYTTVTWVTEDFDTDNIFNLGVSNTNAVPSTTGTYVITAESRFAAAAAGTRAIRILVNGVVVQGTTIELLASPAGTQTDICTTTILPLAAGQIVTIQVLQGSGGALNIDSRRFSLVLMA